jgi:hypothetical protein
MAGLLEVAAKIAADKEQASEIGAWVAASKDLAEETVSALYALGVERRAAQLQQSVVALDEAESMRATLESKLESARQQMLSAAQGRGGPGGRTSSASGTSPTTGAAGGGHKPPPSEPPTPAAPSGDASDDSPRPEPATEFDFVAGLDSEPRPEQFRYIANEPANLPEEIDPFDDSRLTSRPVRAVRVAARGVEDLQGGAKQATTDIVNYQHFFDPPADNAYIESQSKDTGPQFTNDPPAAIPLDPIQAASNFTVMGVAAAKVAVGQMRKRNR